MEIAIELTITDPVMLLLLVATSILFGLVVPLVALFILKHEVHCEN